ncbi:hypothetical protein J7W19_21705 [Streptomyces mobaraensis NBRC 13819 = DSM 40847]|uniref:Integral membrane protein n=2 Tax=Streptomyces mobaraensis TaxID=35621 RepID=A0A5N5WFD0_STRMB|nr:hypothetical protein [Streptomyces mobaraensis]EMF02617.1 putative integral membrane protein [Streptomyces mobaraensis NBRC 13819 = DSM 40847]KAB7851098.1 hypothetical protein FRZ00_02900 [Streptomyces mobaraensis]QTT75647.1 hypothetical protein J7W19_21705 [Streptomyces mobaraensis NBRC 13819 = DSM 40847]
MSSKQSASKSARKSAEAARKSAAPERDGSKAPDVPEPAGPRPARLTAAAALAGLEGLALLIGGLYILVMGLLGKPDSPRQAVTGGATMVALALLPLAAARGLLLRRRWSRGPALITQLVAFPVAWSLINGGGGLVAAGVVLALAAVLTLGLLVNPTATEALGIGPRES